MTENESLVINTPRNPGKIPCEKKSMPITEKANLKPSANSIASTEINSIKKISLEENMTPKKKPKSKLEAIKTFCRIRPTKSPNELFSISQKDDKILNINSENLEKLNVGNNLKLINSYKFSKVFDQNSSQEEVYELTCKPLIDDLVINNKSGLIFTYGMTNAGKTYTVIGTPENPGILPLALKNLMEYEDEELSQIKKNKFNNNFYCNFVEIYNEDVFDLLADDPTGKKNPKKKKIERQTMLHKFLLDKKGTTKFEGNDKNNQKYNTKKAKGITENVMDFESFKKKKNLGNNNNSENKYNINTPWNNFSNNSKKEEKEEKNNSDNSLDEFQDDDNDDIIMMKNENNEYKIKDTKINNIKNDFHPFKEQIPPEDDFNSNDNDNEEDNDNDDNKEDDEEKYTNEEYIKEVMGKNIKINDMDNTNNNKADEINLAKNEIICIYNKQEDEIGILHDYNENIDFWLDQAKNSYSEGKKI